LIRRAGDSEDAGGRRQKAEDEGTYNYWSKARIQKKTVRKPATPSKLRAMISSARCWGTPSDPGSVPDFREASFEERFFGRGPFAKAG